MKICCTCKVEQPLDNFYNAKQHKYGKSARCKPCTIRIASEWNKANLEKARRNARECARRHKERQQNYAKRRLAENPDYIRLQGRLTMQRRRSRMRQLPSDLTAYQWQRLLNETGNRCLCCGVSGESTTLDMDHIVPVVHGGAHTLLNIQPLCHPCNASKHTKTQDFRTDWITIWDATTNT